MAVATELRLLLGEHHGISLAYLTFYPATMLVAVAGGLGAGILTTLLSAACADYLFLEPLGHFGIKSASDSIGLAVFVSMGLFISVLAETVHRTRERAGRGLSWHCTTAKRCFVCWSRERRTTPSSCSILQDES